MCGVAGIVGGGGAAVVERALIAMRHRGPDASAVVERGGLALGHARLAILDLDSRSDQPFERGDVLLSYNGELWNFREVRAELEEIGEEFRTEGDTEVVAAALERWGEAALARFNGMFALAWLDGAGVLRLARDRFGEVPLHYVTRPSFAFASELRALRAMGFRRGTRDVQPGGLVRLLGGVEVEEARYYLPPCDTAPTGRGEAARTLRELLRASVRERAVSDVPVCTLLSGGLDSGAVAAFLKAEVPDLVAYTAVYDERSADLRAARMTAEELGVELREVKVEAPSADDLERVIGTIELPFKSQVEIGWPCLELARRMAADGFKVTFSGEGADELLGSYKFVRGLMQKGKSWHEVRRDLFLDQARKNFPRCNKAFMSESIECRLPFLNPRLVEHVLSLSMAVVRDADSPAKRKAVMQEALGGVLPEAVVKRPKVAFQDGMGLKKACAAAVADPRKFYATSYVNQFGRR